MRGDIDPLRDAKGRPGLLDLKSSRSLRSYRQRVRYGVVLQLAAYSALVGAEERAAYVLLAVLAVVGGPDGRYFRLEDRALPLVTRSLPIWISGGSGFSGAQLSRRPSGNSSRSNAGTRLANPSSKPRPPSPTMVRDRFSK